ncbi:MAG: chorismate-binding protein, partial [Myxococcales bacterium]
MRSESAAFAFEGVPTRETSRALLEQALRGRSADADSLIVTVPAPVAPPDALLRAFPHEASILWDPPQSAACSGLGVAKTLSPNVSSIRDFFDRTDHVADAASPAPRFFGGASFAPGAARQMPWESFGDGFLLLPTWTYHVDERAWLSLALCGSTGPSIDEVLDAFDTLWGSLERPIGVIPSPVSARRIEEADRDTWTRQVDEIRRGIQDGVFRKVVAARHCVVELETGAGSLDVLKRLEERFPGCTRFALWRGDAAFLGATPELLISRCGDLVLSEALAGSTAHGDAARMMASRKERAEHQLVVQAILTGLEPFCDLLRSDAEP